jgi:hypothetical protein
LGVGTLREWETFSLWQATILPNAVMHSVQIMAEAVFASIIGFLSEPWDSQNEHLSTLASIGGIRLRAIF